MHEMTTHRCQKERDEKWWNWYSKESILEGIFSLIVGALNAIKRQDNTLTLVKRFIIEVKIGGNLKTNPNDVKVEH